MSMIIENLTNRHVLLTFNSGERLHLASYETVENIMHVEVKGNAKIDKLQQKRVIALRRTPAQSSATRSRRRTESSPSS